MEKAENTPKVEEQMDIGQIVILFLSGYVLIAMFIETVFHLSDDVSHILMVADNAVCLVFIADFSYRLIRAKNKIGYLKWGWIDLVSSIPSITFLRWGRAVRVIRILRVIRAFRSTKVLFAFLFKNRANGTFASVAMISFLLVIFSSITILNVETDPNSNIKSPEDALWWAVVTITTVGYGDRYPATTEGRIIAAFLMIAGVGLFGTFTAYVASIFMGPKQEKEISLEEKVLARLDELEKVIRNKG
jgi:voltage-gated potassium channel